MTAATGAAPLGQLQAQALLAQLPQLAAHAPPEQQRAWADHQERLEALAQWLESVGTARPAPRSWTTATHAQWAQFGQLLRDRRSAAGLSRVQLGRKAKLSDVTIKFAETARHPPSRATLIRLLSVPELQLRWEQVPGPPSQPALATGDEEHLPAAACALHGPLNCALAPGYDPLALLAERAQFLRGAGGYLEQTGAYLEPDSAAAYLALCHNALVCTELRSRLPLREMAQRIAALCGRAPLQLLALGAGDGVSETRLAGHLLEAGAPHLELCLVDISHPLLACAYHHAVELLGSQHAVHVWGLQGNFHHLPLYPVLQRETASSHGRLFTLLGGTWAHLDHEPRFVQQSLVGSQVGDLLLLDVPLAAAACGEPAALRRQDRWLRLGVPAPYAAWLEGPLRRHCPQLDAIEFHWELETRCPVPGSYALHAVATVKSSQRADRRFCLFRFGRYEPAQLAQCLGELGWHEVTACVYSGEHALCLYRKQDRGLRPGSEAADVGAKRSSEVAEPDASTVLRDAPRAPIQTAPLSGAVLTSR
ncbi:MAG TPA: helix-turn-helix transcriptional regulator [Pseudomonadota bacterium]|nr:helix-turn-helix transcriptional regulator [Pseudomonadota bacterium]